MAAQTARQFFEDVRQASEDAERCRRRLQQLEENALRLGGSSFEPRIRGTSSPDRMEKSISRYVDEEERLRRRTDADYEIINRAVTLLYGPEQDGRGGLCAVLSTTYADALEAKYVRCLKMCGVADAIGMSKRTASGMIATALRTIDERGMLEECA